MNKLAFIFTSLLAVACSSAPQNNLSQTSVDTTNIFPKIVTSESPVSIDKMDLKTGNKQSKNLKSLYFGFDESAIAPNYQKALEYEVALLKVNKNIVIPLEGSADERGSISYNNTSGKKRANSIKKSLEEMGIPASQIKVVSYG